METLAIIPARGGSKAIPRKNVLPFCGHPLLAWSIAAARRCRGIAGVTVSTDDAEIAAVARRYGAGVVQRPAELATDTSPSEAALMHAVGAWAAEGRTPSTVVFLQATSPLRETTELDAALDQFAREGCDSLFSAAVPADLLLWEQRGDGLRSLNYDYQRRTRRQDHDGSARLLIETGSFYIFRTALLMGTGNRLGGRIGACEVPLWKSFEIDTEADWSFCESLMRRHGLDRPAPEPLPDPPPPSLK